MSLFRRPGLGRLSPAQSARGMRALATAMLAGMAAIFIAATRLDHLHPAWGFVRAFAEAGLVERTPDPADRRAWRLQVTDTAQPLIAKLRKLAEGLVDDAFKGLSDQELETMRDNLMRIRDNLAAAEGCRKAANQ